MTRWSEQEFTANDLLLDRQLIDSRGMPAGRVDDLELSDPGPGQPPVLTALLCGPTAYGPRIGGRLGTWWLAIGRRPRPSTAPPPTRTPLDRVDHVAGRELPLLSAREELDSSRSRRWVEDKVI